MFAVFPQYYQPLESHLGFVTKMPALQWFLNPEKIANAYYEIIKERGPSADWYALDSNKLNDWEKLPSLNGITVRKFNRIVKNSGLVEVFRGKPPVFGDGRKAEQFLFFKMLKYMCWLPAKIPILDEIFLGRIVTVLKKV